MHDQVVLHKEVGQTPLDVIRAYKRAHPEYQNIPMAYAGRLDPMASGALLILIGDACKEQRRYHDLDKAYTFDVLFGVSSDSGDILGLLSWDEELPTLKAENLGHLAKKFSGKSITLPYPKFSAKTVEGKPLHMWTLEDRLDEIEIPTATTSIYKLAYTGVRQTPIPRVCAIARKKIDSIPPVTETSKKLGADFRRAQVRPLWKELAEAHASDTATIATFTCVCSSGTYIRSLAEHIGQILGVSALAFRIHRTKIGRYQQLPFGLGFWRTTYTSPR